MTRTLHFCTLLLLLPAIVMAQTSTTAKSPNGRIALELTLDNGTPSYSVNYDGKQAIGKSALGIVTNMGDYSNNLSLKGTETRDISEQLLASRTSSAVT